jgi:cytochrome c biogenesis protein CcdA/thiol-disulfide isomerase/thioredoxin
VALLIAFAFVAGAATAVSPCVLPVLPVALSAGATGGRRRPLGVVTGLIVSFTFATIALVYVIAALGLPDDLLRNVAIAVLAGFGIALLVPRAAARLEVAIGRLGRGRPRRFGGDGFGSGVLLGLSLGLVYAPCAGPILAGVITVSASQEFTADRLAIALSYSAGSAVVLYALMLGGRRLTTRISRRARWLQPAMGAVMVAVAIAMVAQLDIRFQTEVADRLPAALVSPLADLEADAASADAVDHTGDRAPEIVGTQRWFNTKDGRSLTLRELRGKVVLIDFWTYSCINCIRTLPYLKAWDERYRDDGLVIVGMHAPEFPFERDAGNVGRAVRDNGIRYPVAQDNDFATWRAYENQFWPAKYVIDAEGEIRYTHFGEGEYEQTEAVIRDLLAEAGDEGLGERVEARTDAALAGATPESYLGAERAERFASGPLLEGVRRFRATPKGLRFLPLHHLAFDGTWRIERQRAVAAAPRSRLHVRFGARRVFLVLGSPGGPRDVAVSVDGRRTRSVRVDAHRLYELVDLPRAGAHLLTLELEQGTEAYAFTFG